MGTPGVFWGSWGALRAPWWGVSGVFWGYWDAMGVPGVLWGSRGCYPHPAQGCPPNSSPQYPCTCAPMHSCTHALRHSCFCAPLHPCSRAPLHPCTRAACGSRRQEPTPRARADADRGEHSQPDESPGASSSSPPRLIPAAKQGVHPCGCRPGQPNPDSHHPPSHGILC